MCLQRDILAKCIFVEFFFVAFTVATIFQAEGDPQLEDGLKSIFFRFYTGSTIDEFIDVPILKATELVAQVNRNKPTVFYFHGYTGSAKSKDVVAVGTAYLERGDHNLIAVDWSKLAGKKYPVVVGSAKSVGATVAAAIDQMILLGLQREKIHLVGHSMGAQVSGFVGRSASFRFTRITGLDPAGPLFNFLGAHLSASDASFVDTIHTDAGIYGINRSSGSASFYPNGGRRVQPGCPTNYELSSPEDYCSHHRSYHFYAESLRHADSFIGTNCTSYRNFSYGSCDQNTQIPMGYPTPFDARGDFYLVTNSKSPYGMGMNGALSTVLRRDFNRK